MNKRYDFIGKSIITLLITFILLLLSGCTNSELEKEKQQLQLNLEILKKENIQVHAELKDTEESRHKLQEELALIRDENKGLNVSLAKSELEFSQKNKEVIEAENKKLNKKREALKEEKKKIEIEAYINAEETIFNKYLGLAIGLAIILVVLLLIWLYRWKTKSSLLLVKENLIQKLEENIKVLRDEKLELKEGLYLLEYTVEELKRKEKEGTRNQVVSKIETYQSKRDLALSGIRDTNA